MVAIFTGAGAGLERGSASLIGSAGLLGGASLGRSGEQIFLNGATGNLMITQRDEFLVGKGPDASVSRTYNSLGDLSDDNHDNWRQSTDRRVYGLTGTLNAAGSSVRRVSADGTDVVYKWSGAAYVNGETGGAADTLTCAGGVWTWTDGNSQITERYEAHGTDSWRITRQTDTDGLFLSFSYDAASGRLHQIATSDGGTITYGWSGDRITTITTGGGPAGNAGARTRYGYDTSGRLSEVRVDLTPDDGNEADGRTYSTYYTYHGATTRVASISQTDGSKIEFTYDAAGRVDSFTQTVSNGVTQTTAIAYQALKTIVTTAGDSVTTLEYTSEGALRKITAPPAAQGLAPQTVQFTYGATPSLSSPAGSAIGGGSVTKTSANGWGNQVAYGEEAMAGSAVVRFRLDDPNMNGKYQQVGLATVADRAVPGTNYADGAFAAGIYFDNVSNSPMIWLGALGWQRCAASVTGASSDLWTVAYDGTKFHYLKNDQLIHSFDAPPNLDLVFKHRAASEGATVRDIECSTLPKLINGGGSLIIADSITKTAANAWDNQLVYSDQVMSGNASVSFRLDDPIGGNKWQQVGLTSPQWASYQGSSWIDFFAAGIYFWGDSNTIQVTNGDSWQTLAMTGTSADVWTIAYDGANFSYSKNGTVFATMAAAPNMNLAFKYRSPTQGTVIRDIRFGTPAGGRLTAVTDAAGGVTRYAYDGIGNVVREEDPLGNVVTRTYGSRNELRSETRRGSAADAADAPLTTHYVYDAENHLAYVVRPSGEVTDYRYFPDGEIQYSVQYTENVFTVGAAAPTKADLDAWRANIDLSKRLVTEHFYDSRGNLERTRLLGASGEQQDTHFTYDRAGQLLARSDAGQAIERFAYDGLGRVTSSFDLNGGTTRILFRDTSGETIVTSASGLVETSTYDRAGSLVAKTRSTALNHLANGQLLTDTAGWTLGGSARSTSENGVAVRPTFVSLSTSGSANATTTERRPVPPGGDLLLSFAGKPSAAMQFFRHIFHWYAADGTLVGAKHYDSYSADTTGFTTFQNRIEKPVNAATYTLESQVFNAYGGGTAGARWGDLCLTSDDHVLNSSLATDMQGWGGAFNVQRTNGTSAVPFVFHQMDGTGAAQIQSNAAQLPEADTLYLSYVAKAGAAGQLIRFSIFWRDANNAIFQIDNDYAQPSATGFSSHEHVLARPAAAVSFEIMTYVFAHSGSTGASWGAVRLAAQSKDAAPAAATTTDLLAYDKFGQLRVATDAVGARTYFVYDKAGRKIASVDDRWRMTEFVYDANNRLVRTIAYAKPVVEASDRNILAQPNWDTDISTLRPDSDDADVRTWHIYDKAGRLLSTIGNDGSVSRLEYDKSGRLVKTTLFAERLTNQQLQAIIAAQPTTLVLPIADPTRDSVTRSFYDKDGRLLAALDGEGFLTRNFYDRAGQKIEEVHYAAPVPATGTLRAEGTLAAIQASIPAGQSNASHLDRRTRFVYNSLGQLRFVLDGFNQAVEHVYDASGRAVQTNAYDAKLTLGSFDYATVAGAIAPLAASGATRKSFNVYDSGGRPIFSIDAAGAVTGLTYDGSGRVTKTVQYQTAMQTAQAPTRAHMDGWLALDAVQLAQNRVTRSYYNAQGELRYSVDSAGYVTRFDYDAEGRKTAEIRYDTPLTGLDDRTSLDTVAALATGTWTRKSWTYDSVGQLVETRDGEQRGTIYTYDGLGRLKTEQAIGSGESVKSYTYDKAGRVQTQTVTSGVDPNLKATVTYEYDAFGNVSSVKDARNNVSTMVYDRLGRVTEKTDALGGKIEYLYNSFGDAIRIKDAMGNFTHNYYDGLGRLALTVDALNFATRTVYTTFGEVQSVTRYHAPVASPSPNQAPEPAATPGKDATTAFTYDKRGLVLTSTDAENATESYAYTTFGEQLSVTNRANAVTSKEYDRRGLLVKEALEISSVRSDGSQQAAQVIHRFEYDARGNRTKMVQGDNLDEKRTTTYVYDKSNLLIETRGDAVSALVRADDAAPVQVVPVEKSMYDQAGRLVERVDARGGRTLYGYDFLGHANRELSSLGTRTARTHDENGNVTSVRVYATPVALPQSSSVMPPPPGGAYRETIYTYDALNRLEKTTSQSNLRFGAWGPGGYASGDATIETSVRYDKNGNVLWEQDGAGARTYSWYDALNRKIAAADAEGYFTQWTLDKDGNAVSETRYATAVAVSGDAPAKPAAQANAAQDRVTEFAYDRNGRRTEEKRLDVVAWTIDPATGALTPATSAALIKYEYNALGLVSKKTEANGDAVTYTYDKMGRLIEEKRAAFTAFTNDNVTPTLYYSYNGLDQLTRTVQGGGAAGPVRVTRNEYGAGGRLLHTIDAAGAQRAYAYDAAGNVLRETYSRTRSDGTSMTEAVLYDRDALGRVTMQTVATANGGAWIKGDRMHTRYNAFGDVAERGVSGEDTVSGPLQEQFFYDSAGRLFRSNSGDGVWRFFVYDKAGRQTLAIESEGADFSGVTTITQAFAAAEPNLATGGAYADGINVSITAYDRRGLAVRTVLPERELKAGQERQTIFTSRTYNAFGEVASETGALGHDAAGNVVVEGGEQTRTAFFAYNKMGRLITKQNAKVLVTGTNGVGSQQRPTEDYFYDISGRLIGQEDANDNRSTRLLLAGTGHGGSEALTLKSFSAEQGVARRGYDVFGDVRVSIDEIDRSTTMTYDAMGRLVTSTRAGLTDTYGYDQLGQRITHWNSYLGAGTVARTDYDRQGRVVSSLGLNGDLTEIAYAWEGAISTAGMGAFGGWTKTTTYANGRNAIEKTDLFGREVWKRDLGLHEFSSTYDLAGRVATRSGTETVTYGWHNSGLAASASLGNGTGAAYGYDAAGNRISELTTKNGTTIQNATATWDVLGRMLTWAEAGSATSPAANIAYAYDAAGNIRRSLSTHRPLGSKGETSYDVTYDNWYLYDSMNRVVLSKGTLAGGVITRQSGGTSMSYNKAGERKTATVDVQENRQERWWFSSYNHMPIEKVEDNEPRYGQYQGWLSVPYSAVRTETFQYNDAGLLTQVQIGDDGQTGPVRATFSYDAMGRLERQIDYTANGTTVAYDRQLFYNAKGQVWKELTANRQATSSTTVDTFTSDVRNQYGSGTGYALGAVVSTTSDTAKNGSDGDVPDTSTTNGFVWFDGALQASISHKPNVNDNQTWTTTFSYDGFGSLTGIGIADGRPRTVTITNDMNGQAIRRDEQENNDTYDSRGDPHEVWYRFGGRQMGYSGNNGTLETSYDTSIANRQKPSNNNGTGTIGNFRWGGTNGTSVGDFDQSVEKINSYGQGGGGGTHTVRTGDSFQSIAAALWGDSSLWYKIAEANGMGAASALVEGQTLVVPGGVMRSGHNSSTFRPYDASDAVGDASPTNPKMPKKNKCAMVGQIMLVAVAVAVSALTYGAMTGPATGLIGSIGAGAASGAAGSFVSQGVGVATNLQDSFSWKQVAMAGISGAVSGGLGQAIGQAGVAGSKVLTAAVRGAAGSALSQGIGVALKLQNKFDWAGVAAAGIGGAAGAWAEGSLSAQGWVQNAVRNAYGATADAMANAAARTLLTGTSFGDNMMAALPDIIGSTIGRLASDAIAGPRRSSGIVVTHEADSATAERAFGLGGLMTAPDLSLTTGIDGRLAAIRSELAAGEATGDEVGADEIVVTGQRRVSQGAVASQTVRQARATPHGVRSQRGQAQQVGAAAGRGSTVAVVPGYDGIAGGRADGHDDLGFFLAYMGRDLPGYFQQPEYQYFGPGAGLVERYVNFADRLIAQASDYQLRRVILPVLNGWAEHGVYGEGWAAARDRVRARVDAVDANVNAAFNADLRVLGGVYMDFGQFVNPILAAGAAGRDIYDNGLENFDPIDTATSLVSRRGRAFSETVERVAPGLYRMDPRSIGFSQSTVSSTFSDGVNTIDSTAAALRAGRLRPEDLGNPIRLVQHQGRLFSLDNRRLAAFSAAGIDDVPVEVISLNTRSVRREFRSKFNPVGGDGQQTVVIERAADRTAAERVLLDHGMIRPPRR